MLRTHLWPIGLVLIFSLFFLAEAMNFDDILLTKRAEEGLELLQSQSPYPELLNCGYSRPFKPVRFFNETGLPKYANEIEVAVTVGYVQNTIMQNLEFLLLFPIVYDQY